MLYQIQTDTAEVRSVKVGAIGGHISRNFLCDRRGHAYVPRIKAAQRGAPIVTLAEYDTSLKQINETALKYYLSGRPLSAHGITGYAPLPDGSIAFLVSYGWLSLLTPSADGPAKLTDLGWFHPAGPRYTSILFADPTGRFLLGAARGDRDRPYDWVIYDLKTRSQRLADFQISDPKGPRPEHAWLFGSETRDEEGNCYVVGVQPSGKGRGDEMPILLRVQPPEMPGPGPGS